MKTTQILVSWVLAFGLTLCGAGSGEAGPMGTAFTYQGRLTEAGEPAEGLYDFQFKLFDGLGGGQSLYSYVQSGDGISTHANVTQYIFTENALETTCDYITLWISGDGYTTPSRYSWRITLILEDGTETDSEVLRCDCWGNNEGCTPNHYDNYDAIATGADGQTWKRYTRAIPGNIDKSNMTVKIVHQQTSWDRRIAESWYYLDSVYFSDSEGNKCESIRNGGWDQDSPGTSFDDITGWDHSSSDSHGTSYDEQMVVVDDHFLSTAGQLGDTVTMDEVDVIDGYFTVVLDFGGGIFTGGARWLEIGVRPAGSEDDFTALTPPQELTPTPYAIYAESGGDGHSLDAADGSPTDAVYVDNEGNVGIGTMGPTSKLEVDGNVEAGGFSIDGVPVGTSADSYWSVSDANVYYNSGNVGIGDTQPKTLLHVKGNGNFKGNHIACFENTGEDSADGIAVKLANESTQFTNADNNFMTFYNGNDTVVGRIEGFDLSHGDWTPPPLPDIDLSDFEISVPFDPGAFPSCDFSGGSFPSCSLDKGSFPNCTLNRGSLPSLSFSTTEILGIKVIKGISWSSGSLPSLSCSTGRLPSLSCSSGSWPSVSCSGGSLPSIGTPSFSIAGVTDPEDWENMICWALDNDLPNLISMDPVTIAAQSYAIAATKLCKDGGITYGSKGADYAEWLPKLDPNEQFKFGQIVGVHGGKISKKTEGAEQIMAISLAPVVLGNLPPEDEIENYEKVGFMGRLPVVVRGKVKTGDYIIPSGFEDGTGIAVSPEDLRLEHLDKILGRAWTESENDIFGFVDVVVGVKTNEWVEVFERQQQCLEKQNREYADLKAENARLERKLQALNAEVSKMVSSLDKIEKFMVAQLEMDKGKALAVVAKEIYDGSD